MTPQESVCTWNWNPFYQLWAKRNFLIKRQSCASPSRESHGHHWDPTIHRLFQLPNIAHNKEDPKGPPQCLPVLLHQFPPNNGYTGRWDESILLQQSMHSALINPAPWQVWSDPGPLPDTYGNQSKQEAGAEQPLHCIHKEHRSVYQSEQNVERAVIDSSLNAAIPADKYNYKLGGAVFATDWLVNINVRAIIAMLKSTYGRPTKDKEKYYGILWNQPWDTSRQRPIKYMFWFSKACILLPSQCMNHTHWPN